MTVGFDRISDSGLPMTLQRGIPKTVDEVLRIMLLQ